MFIEWKQLKVQASRVGQMARGTELFEDEKDQVDKGTDVINLIAEGRGQL